MEMARNKMHSKNQWPINNKNKNIIHWTRDSDFTSVALSDKINFSALFVARQMGEKQTSQQTNNIALIHIIYVSGGQYVPLLHIYEKKSG